MNPRQRRGMLLLVAAGVGAVVVFVAVLSYVGNVRSQVGDKVTVLKLTKNLAAFQPLDSSDVTNVQVPNKYVTDDMVTKLADVAGLVASTNLTKGAYLQTDAFQQRPDLQPGQRELAILIDAETGVAGKVKSGDRVDIYATFKGASTSQSDVARIIVTDALVINIGNLQTQSNNNGTTNEVPVTFALSVHDSLVLAYAESFADKVRLALIGGGDSSAGADQNLTYTGSSLTPSPSPSSRG